MSSQNMLEKLQLNQKKNLLIQGLPSSFEKQFIKFAFSKNVTPLLKARKIDFALVLAVNQRQLADILKDVIPALEEDAKFWIAYPKMTSKIASDLSRDKNCDFVSDHGFETGCLVALDSVWSAALFKKVRPKQKKRKFLQFQPCFGYRIQKSNRYRSRQTSIFI